MTGYKKTLIFQQVARLGLFVIFFVIPVATTLFSCSAPRRAVLYVHSRVPQLFMFVDAGRFLPFLYLLLSNKRSVHVPS